MAGETAAPAAPATTPAAPPAAPPTTALGAAPTTPAATPATPGTTPAAPTAPAATQTPAPLELKLPEGFDPKDPILGKFTSTAQEMGLDAAKAEKILGLYAEAQAPIRQAIEQHQAEQKAWAAQLRADPEIGGPNYDATMRGAANAVVKFGGPELQKLLNETGLGNNPVLARAFVRISKALGEDSTAGTAGGPQKTAANDEETRLRLRYPTMFQG